MEMCGVGEKSVGCKFIRFNGLKTGDNYRMKVFHEGTNTDYLEGCVTVDFDGYFSPGRRTPGPCPKDGASTMQVHTANHAYKLDVIPSETGRSVLLPAKPGKKRQRVTFTKTDKCDRSGFCGNCAHM
jgi:hypothetical protein